MRIPKKIIFSSPNKNNLHPKIKKNLDNLSFKNQDWEILVFDDDDIAPFIEKNLPVESIPLGWIGKILL